MAGQRIDENNLYTALYDYAPQASDEITLRKGDTVIVLRKLEDGWYRVKHFVTGLSGLAPGNYFEKISVGGGGSTAQADYRSRQPVAPSGVDSPLPPAALAARAAGGEGRMPPPVPENDYNKARSKESVMAYFQQQMSVDAADGDGDAYYLPQDYLTDPNMPPPFKRDANDRDSDTYVLPQDATPGWNKSNASSARLPEKADRALPRRPPTAVFGTSGHNVNADRVSKASLASVTTSLSSSTLQDATYVLPQDMAGDGVETPALPPRKPPLPHMERLKDHPQRTQSERTKRPATGTFENPPPPATSPRQPPVRACSQSASSSISTSQRPVPPIPSPTTPSSALPPALPPADSPAQPALPKKGGTFTRKMKSRLDNSRKRYNITEEIIQTERKYVTHLQEVKQFFIVPLKQMQKPVLKPEEINVIFSNIESLYGVNFTILASLNDRFNDYDPDKTMIGDIFAKMAPFLKLYENYCNSHAQSSALLNQKIKDNAKFKQFLVQARANQTIPQSLDSLLLMPIQRIPRYNLLLEDLFKHTDEAHPDFANLSAAVALLRKVSFDLNENVRRIENEHKTVSIEMMFDKGDRVSIVEGSRTFDAGAVPSGHSAASRAKSRVEATDDDPISAAFSASQTTARSKVYTKADRQFELDAADGSKEVVREPRRFVKEGTLMYKRDGNRRGEERTVFLFTDLLVLAQRKGPDAYRLKERVRLQEAWVADALDDAKTTFVFGTSKNVYTLLSQSPEDALDWQEKISDRISHQKKLLVKYISRFDIPDNISEGRIMRARLDYRGSADAEISFNRGDTLTVIPGVLGYSIEDTWLQGFLGNTFGWFPAGCVRNTEPGAEHDWRQYEKRMLTLDEIYTIKLRMLNLKGGFCYERRPSDNPASDQADPLKLLRVYSMAGTYKMIEIDSDMTVEDTIAKFLFKVKIDDDPENFQLYEISDDKSLHNRLQADERPYYRRTLWGAHLVKIKYVIKDVGTPIFRAQFDELPNVAV